MKDSLLTLAQTFHIIFLSNMMLDGQWSKFHSYWIMMKHTVMRERQLWKTVYWHWKNIKQCFIYDEQWNIFHGKLWWDIMKDGLLTWQLKLITSTLLCMKING